MTRCPACFSFLSAEFAAWVCSSSKCDPQSDEVASRVAGYEISNRTIMAYSFPPEFAVRDVPRSAPCTQCGEPASVRVCPYCHYGPFLDDWMSSDVTCIAMTGARDSGKSVYIAIAVHQLQQLGTRMGLAVDFANEETKSNFRKYYAEPLLEKRGIIRASPDVHTDDSPTRRPLVFSLGVINGRRRYLVLRDVAGEALERETGESNDHLRFLGNADSVLFMFDPVKVTAITDLLRDMIPDQTKESGNPRTVLSNVLRIIGFGTPRLAIVLAKFDTMELLRAVEGTQWSKVMSNVGSAMLRDPSMNLSGYDENDGALLDQEVRSLLLLLNAGDLVNALERPTNGHPLAHRYFAVSMLGESIRSEKVSTRGIKPFRCLDPLRWTLASTASSKT